MNRAFIFPGQGSQIVGMCKTLYEQDEFAQKLFSQLDSILQRPVTNIIFNGPAEELEDTINAQPAIMTCSAALFDHLIRKTGKSINELCSVVAGHSLGEYSALYAAGFMNFEQAIKLLDIRSRSMKAACAPGIGAMAACINIDINDLQDVIDESVQQGICQIANDNIANQIVISGHSENIDLVISQLKTKGYRAIKLKVSAAFHSELMRPAQEQMASALQQERFQASILPVISNVTADIEQDIIRITDNLEQQICGSVKWRQTLDKLAELNIQELVEIGPGKVLSNLASKSGHEFKLRNISNIDEIEEFVKSL